MYNRQGTLQTAHSPTTNPTAISSGEPIVLAVCMSASPL